MEPSSRIVAVGLLSHRDLEALGAGFKRAYPIDDIPRFDDLLKAIDAAEVLRHGERKKEA
jgi:hypothetical protein